MSIRHLYRTKAVAALALLLLGDLLLFQCEVGLFTGLYGLAVVGAVAFVHPRLLRDRAATVALGLAGLSALSLIEERQSLPFLLFFTCLTVAVALPRSAGFDDALRWAGRVGLLGLVAVAVPFRDSYHLLAAFERRPIRGLGRRLATLALPLFGGLVFLALFADANPLIERVLAGLDPGRWLHFLTGDRVAFWILLSIPLGLWLRPFGLRRRRKTRPAGEWPGITVASVGASLTVFNLVFAIENGLDLFFLWSGADLPEGVTLADYAHRGAYPLIVTALLAGGFVLVALRPGTATADVPRLRRLVVLWIGQNLLLVASSARRTLAYVDAYGMSEWRFAALVWMALVALGLGLVCWRLLTGRSGRWLINANALAAGLALGTCLLVVDPATVTAEWNLSRALAAGASGPSVDWCYLGRLGPAALVPAIRFEQATEDPELKDAAARLRQDLMIDLEEAQTGATGGWTFRGARRLAAARALLGQD
ncbi:DUF4153 domain-containing protein [Zavarzinia sp.]|uniref:DUF4153 domain-containing protein n=1 Tax=Zavarzinia sp. TaxID=2027920 RepID=UPI003563AE95